MQLQVQQSIRKKNFTAVAVISSVLLYAYRLPYLFPNKIHPLLCFEGGTFVCLKAEVARVTANAVVKHFSAIVMSQGNATYRKPGQ